MNIIKRVNEMIKLLKEYFDYLLFKNRFMNESEIYIDGQNIFGQYSMIRNYKNSDPDLFKIISNPIKDIISKTKKINVIDSENNMILFDIGANIGLYSIYYAKTKTGPVYAFEPSVFNLTLLARNIFINDVAEIVTLTILYRSFGSLNAVTGSVRSFREIADMVVKHAQSSSQIEGTKRIGSMPHNGLRTFDNTQLVRSFPEFKFTSLSDGIAGYFD